MATQKMKLAGTLLLLLAGTIIYNGCSAQRPSGANDLNVETAEPDENNQSDNEFFDFDGFQIDDPENGFVPGVITDIHRYIGSTGNYRSEDGTRAFYIFSSNRICEYDGPRTTGALLTDALVDRIAQVPDDLKDVCVESEIPLDDGSGSNSETSIRLASVRPIGANDCELEFFVTHPEVAANELVIGLSVDSQNRTLIQDTDRPEVSNLSLSLKCSEFRVEVPSQRSEEVIVRMTIRIGGQTSYSNAHYIAP